MQKTSPAKQISCYIDVHEQTFSKKRRAVRQNRRAAYGKGSQKGRQERARVLQRGVEIGATVDGQERAGGASGDRARAERGAQAGQDHPHA
jgi:hypothetical protein